MPETEKDEVLTSDEAIRYLKVSKPTYLKCIHQKRINAIKVGNGWRVLQSELNKFLKSGNGRSRGCLTCHESSLHNRIPAGMEGDQS